MLAAGSDAEAITGSMIAAAPTPATGLPTPSADVVATPVSSGNNKQSPVVISDDEEGNTAIKKRKEVIDVDSLPEPKRRK